MSEPNYIYIDAIEKKKTPYTPIWIMRQAGRYLPEYMELRSKHDFITVCKTPELATEVTLQPLRRFDFDAAILFSDILVIPEALGQKLEFLENHGPKLSPQVLTDNDVVNLDTDNLEAKLEYVADTVKLLRRELPVQMPLIGFSGSPFTLAVYMTEGKPTRNFKYLKTMMYKEPERLERVLNCLTDSVIRYLKMQIVSGVQAVQIFDTWGGILPVHLFDTFSGRYLKKIAESLKPLNKPVILFSKGGISILNQLADSDAAMLGVDWMTDIAKAKKSLSDKFALQGNLDPTVLYGSKEIIRRETDYILNVFGKQSGHVFNLGHGILPDIPVDNVKFLVDYVHEQSAKLKK
ncbi:MAG: uroporphyrinogen decarboxylase [Calditrichaceae bacterium]|jgi:uroporphyrinogen decarboxylase